MARSRVLFDLIGVVVGVAVAYLTTYFTDVSGYGNTAITAGGFLVGGLVLGFFAYKNDGVKIAGIICGLTIVLGLIVGIIMITGGGAILGTIDNLLEAVIGPVLGVVSIILGVIIMIAVVIAGALFVAAAAIGSAIGEAVWKDKQAEPVASAGAPYQPTQVVTAPIEPTPVQQSRSIVCANCGVSNPGTDSFCTNCGAKLR
ncbi:MAG: hypothetical protein H7645_02100 [Candidatus Heimdallarchaeota archaeon]|nr:hypothetical protein [Candidatus Heimdallarchaeota archaeon]MCK4769110.1 hypothetical protein [Candidatus Heimdallarchaeota archaeon]